MTKVKSIGVMTSGGDSQGMNAAIYSVVRYGLASDIEVYGIRSGYEGLLSDNMAPMTATDVDDIIHRGGTMLRTSRCLEMKTPEGLKKAYMTIRRHGLDGLIVIGGDGSFRGASALSTQYGVNVIGIPGTIDNDLAYTDFTLGFDSAVNEVMTTIRHLRDTMSANNRTCVVEVMGRNCGDIALYAGATSGAEMILVPEVEFTVEEVIARVKHNISRGKYDNVIVLAEGAGKAEDLTAALKPEIVPYHVRSMVVGHLQRGGDASFSDRLLGLRMGQHAVECLIAGMSDRVVGIRDSKIIDEDIVTALSRRKSFNIQLYMLANKLVQSF